MFLDRTWQQVSKEQPLVRDYQPPENGSPEHRFRRSVAWRIIADTSISFASEEVMSSAGCRLIDASYKSLVMFKLTYDTTPRNTTAMSNLLNGIRADWDTGLYHTFDEAICYPTLRHR